MLQRTFGALALLLLGLIAPARAAGIQLLDSDPNLRGAIWTPCEAGAQTVALGRLAAPGVDALSGVKDCPISGAKLPLIIISHGHGGWFGQHNDLNEALADAGFIVAGINHPGDTVDDLREEDPMSIWASRPRDVTRLIDFLLNDWKDKAAIDRDRIGFFGFSLGAYTGLVLLGAKADFRRLAAWCKPEGKWKPCEQARSGHVAASPPPDPRIRAGVLADNALSFAFAPEALATIQVPLQFWRSELGGHGVNAESTASTASNLPAASETHIVPAGHYAFLAPCTVQVAAANPRICVDAPPDFDRAAFHRTFDTEVVRFFSAHLPK